MDIRLEAAAWKAVAAEVAIFPVRPDALNGAAATALDGLSAGAGAALADLAARHEFKAKKGQWLEIALGAGKTPARAWLLGLGEKPLSREDALELGGATTRKLKADKLPSAAFAFDAALWGDAPAALAALALGAELGNYGFTKYLKKNPPKAKAPSIAFASPNGGAWTEADQGALSFAATQAKAVILARDLVNEPPDIATPEYLAQTALKIAEDSAGLVKARIYHPHECEKMGMNLYLAVGRAAAHPARFIRLDYDPPGAVYSAESPRKPEVIIGKGLTFDSGGLSLKPSDGMLTMKCDMSGAAAVLGTFSALAALKPGHAITGIIAACENSIDGNSYHLGDIIEGMGGITVEIHNTDAEGRLTLGDALTYAQKEAHAKRIVDLATLTGACVVALGDYTFGVMGNNEAFTTEVLGLAKAAGEDAWHLPLNAKLRKQIDSKYADLKNVGGRGGGALTAGLFLKEFVDDATPWVHLDIAGPAFGDEDRGHISKGGSGVGVLTLLQWLAPRG